MNKDFKTALKSAQDKGLRLGGGAFPAIDSLSDDEAGQSTAHTSRLRSKAHGFTLAEVLITLAIIGVVAALTLPTLITNINKKVVEHQKTVIDKRFDQGLRLYSTQDSAFNGQTYLDTEDFLNGLSNYFKMVKICGSDNIQDCIPYTQIKYKKSETEDGAVEVSSIKSPKDLSLKNDEYYNPAAFVTAAGIPYIVALKKNCIIDPDSNDISPAACIAGLYDYNGSRVKNKFGDDIISMNGAKVGGVTCIKKFGDVCVIAAFSDITPLTQAECEAQKGELGIEECKVDEDYWAGAVKACKDVGGSLPGKSQLYKIDREICGVPGNYNSTEDSLQNLLSVISDLGLRNLGTNTYGRLELWSSQTAGGPYAFFYTYLASCSASGYGFFYRDKSDKQAVCVGN